MPPIYNLVNMNRRPRGSLTNLGNSCLMPKSPRGAHRSSKVSLTRKGGNLFLETKSTEAHQNALHLNPLKQMRKKFQGRKGIELGILTSGYKPFQYDVAPGGLEVHIQHPHL